MSRLRIEGSGTQPVAWPAEYRERGHRGRITYQTEEGPERLDLEWDGAALKRIVRSAPQIKMEFNRSGLTEGRIDTPAGQLRFTLVTHRLEGRRDGETLELFLEYDLGWEGQPAERTQAKLRLEP